MASIQNQHAQFHLRLEYANLTTSSCLENPERGQQL